MVKLQKYVCHKTVHAAKIAGVTYNTDGTAELQLLAIDATHRVTPAPHTVSAEWWTKHKPQAGGYLVRYEDGYESFLPAKAFEDGYTLAEVAQ